MELDKQMINWVVIYFGLKYGYCDKKVVSDLAEEQLSLNDNADAQFALKILLEIESLTEEDISIWLELYLQEKGLFAGAAEENAKKIWRLLYLKKLSESNISDTDKIEELQKIYANFGYPADMEKCSIYSCVEGDPLDAMKQVIFDIERELIKR